MRESTVRHAMHNEPLILDSNIAFFLRILNTTVLIHGRA